MDDATLGPQANHQVLASIDLSFCLAEKKKKEILKFRQNGSLCMTN